MSDFSNLAVVVGIGFLIAVAMRSSNDKEELVFNPWGPPPDYGTGNVDEVNALQNFLGNPIDDDSEFPDAESALSQTTITETVYGIPVQFASSKYREDVDRLIMDMSQAQQETQAAFVRLKAQYDTTGTFLRDNFHTSKTKILPEMMHDYTSTRETLFQIVGALLDHQGHMKAERSKTELRRRLDRAITMYKARQEYMESEIEQIQDFIDEHEPRLRKDPLDDNIDDSQLKLELGSVGLPSIVEEPPSNPQSSRPTLERFTDTTPTLPSHESSLIPRPKARLNTRLNFDLPTEQFTSPKRRPEPGSAPGTTTRPVTRTKPKRVHTGISLHTPPSAPQSSVQVHEPEGQPANMSSVFRRGEMSDQEWRSNLGFLKLVRQGGNRKSDVNFKGFNMKNLFESIKNGWKIRTLAGSEITPEVYKNDPIYKYLEEIARTEDL